MQQIAMTKLAIMRRWHRVGSKLVLGALALTRRRDIWK
jgi:hypothetical protein